MIIFGSLLNWVPFWSSWGSKKFDWTRNQTTIDCTNPWDSLQCHKCRCPILLLTVKWYTKCYCQALDFFGIDNYKSVLLPCKCQLQIATTLISATNKYLCRIGKIIVKVKYYTKAKMLKNIYGPNFSAKKIWAITVTVCGTSLHYLCVKLHGFSCCNLHWLQLFNLNGKFCSNLWYL